jgi:hypothetical protein
VNRRAGAAPELGDEQVALWRNRRQGLVDRLPLHPTGRLRRRWCEQHGEYRQNNGHGGKTIAE